MSLLPDTSAWSALLRRRRSPELPEPAVARMLRARIARGTNVYLTGIIYQEVLQGIRSESQRRRIVRLLAPFPWLQTSRPTHERAARLRDRCLCAGVTVSTVDVLIAQVAIDHRCRLLTTDGDFLLVAPHAKLRLQLVPA